MDTQWFMENVLSQQMWCLNALPTPHLTLFSTDASVKVVTIQLNNILVRSVPLDPTGTAINVIMIWIGNVHKGLSLMEWSVKWILPVCVEPMNTWMRWAIVSARQATSSWMGAVWSVHMANISMVLVVWISIFNSAQIRIRCGMELHVYVWLSFSNMETLVFDAQQTQSGMACAAKSHPIWSSNWMSSMGIDYQLLILLYIFIYLNNQNHDGRWCFLSNPSLHHLPRASHPLVYHLRHWTPRMPNRCSPL